MQETKHPRTKRINPVPFKWKADPIDTEKHNYTRNADEFRLGVIHRFGTTSVKFGSTSTTFTPGLSVVFYPNRETDIGQETPRITIIHHDYASAVDKMYFVVVGIVARIKAGEKFE